MNEKQTEKENAATKMMVRAMRAGRFDFQERIIDFFFEEVRLVFLFFLFWKEEREREKKRSRVEKTKKIHRGEVSEFLLDDNAAFFRRKLKKENFFLSFLPRTKIKM